MLFWQKYCWGFINYVCPKGRTGKTSLCPRSSVCYRKMDWLLFLTWAMRSGFSLVIIDHVSRQWEKTLLQQICIHPLQHCNSLLPVSRSSELCLKPCPQPVQPCLPPPQATQTSGMQRLSPPLYLRGYFCAACLSSVPRSLINILFQIPWTSGIWFACLLRQWYPFRLVREGWRLKLPFFGKTQSTFSSLLLQFIHLSAGIAGCWSI